MGIPFGGGNYGEFVRRTDRPRSDNDPIGRINYVSAGYLEALGTRLLAGRRLREADDSADAPRAVVVNEAVVRECFPSEDPIGQNLSILGQEWRIVGVVADVPDRQLDEPSNWFVYVPHVFNPTRFSIVVRTSLEPLSLVGAIRGEIQHLDPTLPLANIRTLDAAMGDSMSQRRMVLGLIGSFAGAALLLACIGLYGVMAYSVAIRRRELSIRLALGAERRNVIGLILGDSALLTSVGLILGVAGALGAARLLASQLYRVSSHDPLVIAGTTGAVFVVALFACWLPAWRATQVNPVQALRAE
jgi:predicted permease